MIDLRPAFALLLSATLLNGCATTPAEPGGVSPASAYFAWGIEPFWNLEITPEKLNFNRPNVARLEVANPGWQPATDGRAISTARIGVTQLAGPCSDRLSHRRYTDRVTVTVSGQVYTGCGGAVSEPTASALEQSSWRIAEVNGRQAVAGVEADLSFADGRVTGTAGCNRLSGGYNHERNRLTFNGVAMTRMACMGPRGDQEDRVMVVLNQPLTIRFGERMTMTWTAPDGSSIALRRLDWD